MIHSEKTYKPINVPKPSWARYSETAAKLGDQLGTGVSIPKMLDMAVSLLQDKYHIN